ncbi:phage holin family protein [Enterococcus cecorum]|uniref:phage holin family protein n=1 Tax=Enterococcus cecorum TaxID=44008 RepID=UPI0032663FBF
MMIIDNLKLLAEFRHLADNVFIQVFIWLVLFDVFTGISKGLLGKQGNSTKGLLGIVKHLLVVLLVIVAYPYMRVMGMSLTANAFVIFYIAVYGISVTENLGQLGLPLPKFVIERLEKLRDGADKGDDVK